MVESVALTFESAVTSGDERSAFVGSDAVTKMPGYRRKRASRKTRADYVKYLSAKAPSKYQTFTLRTPVFVSPSIRVKGWQSFNKLEADGDPTTPQKYAAKEYKAKPYHFYDQPESNNIDSTDASQFSDTLRYDNTFYDKQAVFNAGDFVVQPWNTDAPDGNGGMVTLQDLLRRNRNAQQLFMTYPMFKLRKVTASFRSTVKRRPRAGPWSKPYRSVISGMGDGFDMSLAPVGNMTRGTIAGPLSPGQGFPYGMFDGSTAPTLTTLNNGIGSTAFAGNIVGYGTTIAAGLMTPYTPIGTSQFLNIPGMAINNYAGEDRTMRSYYDLCSPWDSRRMKFQRTLCMSRIDSTPVAFDYRSAYWSPRPHFIATPDQRVTDTRDTYPVWVAGGWPFSSPQCQLVTRQASIARSNYGGQITVQADDPDKPFFLPETPWKYFNEIDWKSDRSSRRHEIFGTKWTRSLSYNMPMCPTTAMTSPPLTTWPIAQGTGGMTTIDVTRRSLDIRDLPRSKRLEIHWENVPIEGFMVEPCASTYVEKSADDDAYTDDCFGSFNYKNTSNPNNIIGLPEELGQVPGDIIETAGTYGGSRLYYQRRFCIGYVTTSWKISFAGAPSKSYAENVLLGAYQQRIYDPPTGAERGLWVNGLYSGSAQEKIDTDNFGDALDVPPTTEMDDEIRGGIPQNIGVPNEVIPGDFTNPDQGAYA